MMNSFWEYAIAQKQLRKVGVAFRTQRFCGNPTLCFVGASPPTGVKQASAKPSQTVDFQNFAKCNVFVTPFWGWP
jgi:hypothetical protein